MDSSQTDALVHRLVENPHDEQALGAAHQAGTSDPKSYALFLERVGSETHDAAYASHWLSEAANVWSTTLGDAHRAARALMQAIDRDPTARTAADRLAQLYRDKGDTKALVALLERRTKALAPLAGDDAALRADLTAMHEELGRLWGETLQQPKKALEHFRRAIEFDSSNAFAVYGARETYKALGQWADALPLYEAELQLEKDPARRVAIVRDEAAARKAAGDLVGASHALARARTFDAHDPTLQQEYATLVVERLSAGEDVPSQERTLASELLVGLAETYDGEHGLAYSGGALDIQPGHDRALQLYAYYARSLQKEDDLASRYLGYLGANPEGPLASEARWLLAGSYEAAGDFEQAVQFLEPLRAVGDSQAASKLRDLYERLERPMPATSPPLAPPARPEARPARVGASPLDTAQLLASAGKRDEAYAKYIEVLTAEPGQSEALAWAEDYLRTKRDYKTLRDILAAAARAPSSAETRKERLREIAALSDGNLRDPEGAIDAWKQLLALDHGDEVARQSLTRALERTGRWDDLAQLVEREATQESDLEKRIALEKRLAGVHELRRKDFASAAEAWERIANLAGDDDQAIATASELFERAGDLARAADVVAANVASVSDLSARDALLERLGQLREQLGDRAGAGAAYAEAAEHALKADAAKLLEAAERCYAAASAWDRAAQTAVARATLDAPPAARAKLFARAALHFAKAGDEGAVVDNLERACDLDPDSDEYARILAERYSAAGRTAERVTLLTKRADRLAEPARRVAVRREAARLLAGTLHDSDGAREAWRAVLKDGEDTEALGQLVEDSVVREDFEEATALLRRLEAATIHPADKARVALREAELVAEGLGDVATAIGRYERVLAELDPSSRPALQAIADLQEANENPRAASAALERELAMVEEPTERASIATRLARIYEQLDDPDRAIAALEAVREADPDDFDALARLCALCEKTHKWQKVAELLAQRIEVEADDAEMSALTLRLAVVLADELGRGDEALAVLAELADQGDAPVRAAYVKLGDRLGWSGVVAAKLVEWWFDAKPGPERIANLRGAFDRLADVGRDEEAVRVGCELARSRGADAALAHRLEELALKVRNLDALSVAHDLVVRDMTGNARATELVRQAEVRLKAGAPRFEALSHGEQGLTSIPPGEAEELLQRLASITEEAGEVVDLYERQIGRCKTPADRVSALGRAAQVAAAYGEMDRARSLLDLALMGTPTDDAVLALEEAAREADANLGDDRMRRAISAAMAGGGGGARDGGRTRGALLRRAASMAFKELHDADQAFAWLGDALVAHVEAQTLDALEAVARELGAPERAEATLTRALGDVFDGPLVRQLLARRAKLRRDALDDKVGAAADLRKLYELSPGDLSTLGDLTALLTELGDHRAMVQLYEDQILRGKDPTARAELARKVARMWETELGEPREAADAWRRVLRMKAGDAEAQAGLERAKTNMLRRSSVAPAPVVAVDDNANSVADPFPPPPAAHAPAPVAPSSAAPEPVAVPAEPALHASAVDTEPDASPEVAASATAAAEVDASVSVSVEVDVTRSADAGAAASPATSDVPHAKGDAPEALSRSPRDSTVEPDDILVADDLAVMIDSDVDAVDEAAEEEARANAETDPKKPAGSAPPPLPGKRSAPPPLPRA
jgi:hypothetical protein